MRKARLTVTLVLAACSPQAANNTEAVVSEPDRTPVLQNDTAEPAKPAPVATADPDLGRCYGDSCSWSLTQSSTIVKQQAGDTLIRLTLLGGSSPNDSDGDPKTTHISWNAAPHDVYVFCSKRLPAVIMKSDPQPELKQARRGYQVDILDFVNGIPGGLESSANLFIRACYPKQDWADPDFAKRNGMPAFDEEPQVTISAPEDIFHAAPDSTPSQ